MQGQLQFGTAHSRRPWPEECTLHEAELSQGQQLPLGRTLSDSSKTNFPASFFRLSDSQAATLDCDNTGRQTARPSLTEQQLSSMSQPNHSRYLAILPAAPSRKLPQHTFPHHFAATCSNIAEKPSLTDRSESSVGLCQKPHECCMQSETVTSLPQHAVRAASMSALMAVAQPVSSAEELLKRLQTESIAATANTSNGHGQHSGSHDISALASFKANHAGATARHVRAAGRGCSPSSPAFMAHSETGSFRNEHEGRHQPYSCTHPAQLVDNWLAQNQRQTGEYGNIAHVDLGAA